MFTRYYMDKIEKNLEPGKVLVIYGPRRVGKTTLVQTFLEHYPGKVFSSTGENTPLREVLESGDFSKIIPFFSGYDLIVIDEAQKIEKVGQGLKIIVDQIPHIRVIATGSSSFDLSNKLGEPLVGRQNVFMLYPLSAMELKEQFGPAHLHTEVTNHMIYGTYPEVLLSTSHEAKRTYLTQIRDAYLYKDILELEQIRNAKKILDLLRLLAFQIGKEVSVQELGNTLDMSRNTVERYLDLLEKAFVIRNIRGYAKNLRKEVTKMSRYYFLDNGIRNAVISNFNDLQNRDDVGQLWENYLVAERIKKQTYHSLFANSFFWRTWDQKEIDFVEERDGTLHGYEFKWGSGTAKEPALWKETYPDASYRVINKDTFLDFIT